MFQIRRKKLKNITYTVPWTYVIDRNGIDSSFLELFTKEKCEKQIKKSLELKKQ